MQYCDRLYCDLGDRRDSRRIEFASTQTKSGLCADSKKSKFGVGCALRTIRIRRSPRIIRYNVRNALQIRYNFVFEKLNDFMNKSNAYIELLTAFPPRPINAESELIATQETIDSLLDKSELTPDEHDYLNLLELLVYEYEQTLEPIPDIYGIELLKALIEEFDLRQKDLVPIFKTESIVSDILREKRQLTTQHIQKLAEFFCISPAAFLPLHPASKDSQQIEFASTQT